MKNSRVGWPHPRMLTRTQSSLGRFAVPLGNSHGFYTALGGRKIQDFLLRLSYTAGLLSNAEGGQNRPVAKNMWVLMWVGRSLIFSVACNVLKRLVAGEGFEPSTFGL